jgi:hypothetical protein
MGEGRVLAPVARAKSKIKLKIKIKIKINGIYHGSPGCGGSTRIAPWGAMDVWWRACTRPLLSAPSMLMLRMDCSLWQRGGQVVRRD